jgi:hypothetical protein
MTAVRDVRIGHERQPLTLDPVSHGSFAGVPVKNLGFPA